MFIDIDDDPFIYLPHNEYLEVQFQTADDYASVKVTIAREEDEWKEPDDWAEIYEYDTVTTPSNLEKQNRLYVFKLDTTGVGEREQNYFFLVKGVLASGMKEQVCRASISTRNI